MNRQSYPKGSTGMNQFIHDLRKVPHQARAYAIHISIEKECERHEMVMNEILECLHEANDPEQRRPILPDGPRAIHHPAQPKGRRAKGAVDKR